MKDPVIRCLIVEDERDFAELLVYAVQDFGAQCTMVNRVKDALEKVEQQTFDLVILDNHLPDGVGRQVFDRLREKGDLPVTIILTGIPELSQAVEMTRHGLTDYLTKPISEENLEACVNRARAKLRHRDYQSPRDEFYAGSPAMRGVQQKLIHAANNPEAAVLITGETGVGKDVATRYIHSQSSGGSANPDSFISVNCGAIPSEMFEAELFGSEKGAYTGADRKRGGLVEAANHGTLFLDEIGEIPLALQAKLLHLLESREYRSLGSTKTKTFSGRVVAATNKDLRKEVAEGRFREDLLFRIDVLSIHIPPLRDRAIEIPGLAELLLAQLSEKYRRSKPTFKPEDFDQLSRYPFPGNIRELRNLIERSLLHTDPDAKWLNLDLAWLNAPAPSQSAPQASPTPTSEPAPTDRKLTPMEKQEYETIRQAMIDHKGGIRRAASYLGITHQTLLRRLQKWPELRNTNEG